MIYSNVNRRDKLYFKMSEILVQVCFFKEGDKKVSEMNDLTTSLISSIRCKISFARV